MIVKIVPQKFCTPEGLKESYGIIVNGRPEALLDSNLSNDPATYFSYLGANSDGIDHVRLLGNNTFGFEDLKGGGDFDYQDFIVKVKLTPIV
jgi:hypothetical protein